MHFEGRAAFHWSRAAHTGDTPLSPRRLPSSHSRSIQQTRITMSSRPPMGPYPLPLHQHGKSKVRLGRVWREGDVHHMVEWNVNTMIESDMEHAFVKGDNAGMTATDTQKNTVSDELPLSVRPNRPAAVRQQRLRAGGACSSVAGKLSSYRPQPPVLDFVGHAKRVWAPKCGLGGGQGAIMAGPELYLFAPKNPACAGGGAWYGA